MPFLQLESSLGMDHMDLGRFETILVRLVIAALLGAFLGYRAWRRLLPNALPPARETAQAQTLIAVAGALMVAVIGDSTARAFGLVGLGGFIRFRSGIKDPRDAAVMFVMIGIGMASGLGAFNIAAAGTLFFGAVLVVLDATVKQKGQVMKVTLELNDLREALPKLLTLHTGTKIVSVREATGTPGGTIVVDLPSPRSTNGFDLLQSFRTGLPGVRSASLDAE